MSNEYKSGRLIKGIIFCILLNFGGKLLAEYLNLPLWLDTIGTVLAAYSLGPVCGAIIGAAANIMYGAFDPVICIYAVTGVLTGITIGICAKKNMFTSAFLATSVAMIVAGISALVSVFPNIILYDGYTGNMWGDGVINYLNEVGIPRFISFFTGEFCLDLLDRFVSVLIIFWFIKIHNKRISQKKINNGIVAALAVVLLVGVIPANPANAARKYSNCFDTYVQKVFNRNNGIPGSEVNAIAQTRDGLLWVGTYGGLYQYDGNRFTFMSQFDSVRNVNCLYTDEEGRLLIGTNDSGVSICANNEIVNIVDREGGLPSDSVRSIAKSSDGIYYVGTSGAMCSMILSDGMKVSNIYNEMNYVTKITSMGNGVVAAVSADGILAFIESGNIIGIYGEKNDEIGYTSVYYNDEFLYTATTDDKVNKCILKNRKLEVVESYDCSPLKKINDIRLNDDGHILLCADNGVGCIDENGQFGLINTNGFDNSLDNILVDYQGNIWFSSSRYGLLELSKSIAEEVYTKVGFEETVVNAVVRWNGRYFFGTDNGLSIADDRLEKQVQTAFAAELSNVRIRCLLVDQMNHMWISTSGQGIYEVLPSGKCNKYDTGNGLVGNKTRSLIELKDGTVVASADNGISFIRNGEVVKNINGDNGLATTKTLCLYEYNGTIYAGTDGGGIALIKNESVVDVINRTKGLSSDVILRIVESSDGSGLFVIASNGLNFISKEGDIRQLKRFPYYDNFDIIVSENGKLWVTSSAGVYIVDEKNLLGDGILEYELLDSKKGLQSNLLANSWNYLDEGGRLFLCCSNGVLALNMTSYDTQKTSYRISLQKVNVDGKVISVDKEEINYISRDVVRIEFFPLVINYSVSDPLISVWLEGFDSEPKVMYQSELESITYTNLSSGEYTFHLAVLGNDKESVLEEITYRFFKENEIYDNWWFGLYLVLIGGIIAVYFIWLVVGSQISKSVKLQKKELENLRLKQEADAAVAAGEAKNRFLALMSHDIRTPINAILGMNEMILRESNEKQINEYASDIKGAGNNLLSLVNTILDFSKIEEGKMEIIPARYETRKLVNNLINGIAFRAKNKGLEFKIEVEESLPTAMYGDDVRLSQVISNLLTNAVKYTKTGYVRFIIKEAERTSDDIMLYVEVSDSGIGIKKEDMGKLFEDFTRLDENKNRNIEGTGLGMSIVSNLLSMMDSKIEVESTYGVGSKFYFTLRQRIIDASPVGDILRTDVAEHKKEELHLKAPTASILAVDDNKLNIKVVSSLLKINGIVPDSALDGYTALAYMREKHYDIVFLDHMMPEMDGIETFRRMKSEKLIKDTKVIILTANAINGAREEYINEGFDDYLTKPLDVYSLEQKLRKYIPESKIENADEIAGTMTDDSEIVSKQSENDEMIGTSGTDEKESAKEEGSFGNSEKVKLLKCCPELDYEIGMRYCMGSMEFYEEVLKEYLDGNKGEALDNLFEQKDISNYRILIHAVKSNSMSIGAVELSERAKALEMAAKEQNIKQIEAEHADFMRDYKQLLANISDYFS